MTLIDLAPYRGYVMREIRNIVSAGESGDAQALIDALKTARARRTLNAAFPEIADDLRKMERANKRDAA